MADLTDDAKNDFKTVSIIALLVQLVFLIFLWRLENKALRFFFFILVVVAMFSCLSSMLTVYNSEFFCTYFVEDGKFKKNHCAETTFEKAADTVDKGLTWLVNFLPRR